jgi:DNA-binding MarR family transcriptional regulator
MARASEPPLIGALLRHAWQSVRQQVIVGLHEAGFMDLRPPHLAVLQHPAPRGARPSELAARAGMSRQAMNQLLNSLEEAGYVERRIGSDNTREIWLTSHGERAARVIRRTIEALEEDWSEHLGPSRFHNLKSALQDLRAR